jgi:hypothetical protein
MRLSGDFLREGIEEADSLDVTMQMHQPEQKFKRASLLGLLLTPESHVFNGLAPLWLGTVQGCSHVMLPGFSLRAGATPVASES